MPVREISDNRWLRDLASVVDITIYLSELNIKLHNSNPCLGSLLSNGKPFVANKDCEKIAGSATRKE